MKIAGHNIGVCSWSLQPANMADLGIKVRELGLGDVQLGLLNLIQLDDKLKHLELGHLRASGIHLIVATQYPDRKTVGGALKMNLSGRVCLRVSSYIQSNMIINQSGAERLLGKGDLFFLSIGDPVRLQAPYLSAVERASIFGGASLSASRG